MMQFLTHLHNAVLGFVGKNLIVVLAVLGIFFLMSLMLSLTRHPVTPPSFLHRTFLVLLRIAIGWHLFVEGMEKVHWEKEKGTPWSGEAYLRESSGPLAPYFRKLAGDRVYEQLQVGDKKEAPKAILQDWDVQFATMKDHYGLSNFITVQVEKKPDPKKPELEKIIVKEEPKKVDEKDDPEKKAPEKKAPEKKAPEKAAVPQLEQAQAILDQAKQHFVDLYNLEKLPVELPSDQPPPIVVNLTLAERAVRYKEYEATLREAEKALESKGENGFADWKRARTNFNKFRTDLKKDLDKLRGEWTGAVASLLNEDQKAKGPPTATSTRPMADWTLLEWSDKIVMYGLVGVGACLIAGFFTRLACLLGAVLLISFYVAMPPLPYLPSPPNAEGHYLYVNKNLIEILALLALMTCRSGWWLGFDGFLRFLNPFTWNKPTN